MNSSPFGTQARPVEQFGQDVPVTTRPLRFQDWYLDRYWDWHASFATTRLHNAIRDGVTDIIHFCGGQRKRKDMNRMWSRDYRFRQYQRRRISRSIRTVVADEYEAEHPITYEPLNGWDGIRLLCLLPGRENDAIACKLIHVNTCGMQMPSYEALSYTWGPKTLHIISCNDKYMTVSENLWLALQRLRYKDSTRMLWVDAICINQSDTTEKSRQVTKMKSIYQRADKVVVWLGEGGDGDGEAFQLIERLSSAYHYGAVSGPPISGTELVKRGLPTATASAWKALSYVFWREWYFRAWIVQEVVTSREVSMMCGPYVQPYRSFTGAALFIELHSLVPVTGVDPLPLRRIMDVSAAYSDTIGPQAVDGLLPMLSQGRNSLATDPRDKVFALLNLISPANDYYRQHVGRVKPDYTKSIQEVYVEVAAKHVQRTHDLDILSAVEDRGWRLCSGLPSWVPDWQVHRAATPFHTLHQYEEWKASGITDASDATAGPVLLKVRGCVVDECTLIADTFLERLPSSGTFKASARGNMGQHVFDFFMQRRWRQWAKMAEKAKGPYPNSDSIHLAYAHTLVADATFQPDMTQATDDNDDEAQITLDHYHAFNNFWTSFSGPNQKDPHSADANSSPKQLQQALDFMERYKDAAYGRRLFITRIGYMGLCHPSVRAGDKVAVLAGGKTPYILKAQGRRAKHWTFAGECYVHGMMVGETMKDPVNGVFENERWFEIC